MSKINKITSLLSLGIITVTPIVTVISCKKPVAPKPDSGSDQTGKDKTGKDKTGKDKTGTTVVKQSDLKAEIEKKVNVDFLKAAAKRKDDISKVNLAMVKGVLNGHLDKKFKTLVNGIKAVVLSADKKLTITLGDNTKVVISGVEITKKVVENKAKTIQQLINAIVSSKKKHRNRIKALIAGQKKTSEITVKLVKQFIKDEFKDKTFSKAIDSISAVEMKPKSSSEAFTLIIRFKDSNKIASISNVYLEKIITQKEVNHYGEYTSTMKGFLGKYAELIANTTPNETKVFAHENNGHYSLDFASTQAEYIASGLELAKKFGFGKKILGATTDKLGKSVADANVPLKKNKLVVGFYSSKAKAYSYYDYQRKADGTLIKDEDGKPKREEFTTIESALNNYEKVVSHEVKEFTIFNYIKGSWSDLKKGLSEAGVDITTGEFKTQADAIDKFLIDNEPKIVVDDKVKDKAFLEQFKGEITEIDNPIISKTSGNYKATLHTGKTGNDPYYVLYGLEYAKQEYKGSSRELFVNKGIKKIYVLKVGEQKSHKNYAFIWLELQDGKIVLAQRFFKQKFPDIAFTRNFGFPDIDSKYAALGAYVKNIVNGTETSTGGGSETKVKTSANLKAEIANKSVAIKAALTGETSKLEIDKVKKVLKDQLDDAYDVLINALTLKSKADESVVVTSGSTEITITTSTTTPVVAKTIDNLKTAIEAKIDDIKSWLDGGTNELTISKIKTALKENLTDTSFNNLIDGLTLVTKENGKVTVKSGNTTFEIKTSTVTSKTPKELQDFIETNKIKIKTALTGKTSELKIEAVKNAIKDQAENNLFDALIEGLTLKSKTDESVVVTSGSTEITIETSTTTPVVAKTSADLKAEITNKSNAIKTALTGETSKLEISKVKEVLKAQLDDAYDALINALTLITKADRSVVVTSGSTEITITTSTTTPVVAKTSADLKAEITAKSVEIKAALTGETSKMTIAKVKTVLKAQLDAAYDALINALTLTSKADGSVAVASGSTEITITTSTATPVVAKTSVDLKAEITNKSNAIKTALTGETSKMEISKVKEVLKAQLDDAYDALINALTLTSKVDGSVVVTSGSTEITITTSTTILPKIHEVHDLGYKITGANKKPVLLTGTLTKTQINAYNTQVKKFNANQSFLSSIAKERVIKSLLKGQDIIKARDLGFVSTEGSENPFALIKEFLGHNPTAWEIKGKMAGLIMEKIDYNAQMKKFNANQSFLSSIAKERVIKSLLKGQNLIKAKYLGFVSTEGNENPFTLIKEFLGHNPTASEIKERMTYLVMEIVDYNAQMKKYNADQIAQHISLVEYFKNTLIFRKSVIKQYLSGETNKISIDKIKTVLKSQLSGKFDALIDKLTLGPKSDGEVIVKLGTTQITIKTSTWTYKTPDQLRRAIELISKNRSKFANILGFEKPFRKMMKDRFITKSNSTKKIKQILEKVIKDPLYKNAFKEIESIDLALINPKAKKANITIKYKGGKWQMIGGVELRKVTATDVKQIKLYKGLIRNLLKSYSTLIDKPNAKDTSLFTHESNSFHNLISSISKEKYQKAVQKMIAKLNWWDSYLYAFAKKDIGKNILEIGNLKQITISNKFRIGYYTFTKDKYVLFDEKRDDQGNIMKDKDGNSIMASFKTKKEAMDAYAKISGYNVKEVKLLKYIKSVWSELEQTLKEDGVDLASAVNKPLVDKINDFISRDGKPVVVEATDATWLKKMQDNANITVETVSADQLKQTSGKFHASVKLGNKYYNLYGATFGKKKANRVSGGINRTWLSSQKSNIKEIKYIKLADEKHQKTLIVAWIIFNDGKIMLAERYLKSVNNNIPFTNDDSFGYDEIDTKYDELLKYVKGVFA